MHDAGVEHLAGRWIYANAAEYGGNPKDFEKDDHNDEVIKNNQDCYRT